jgi:signal transduction histidine kinase
VFLSVGVSISVLLSRMARARRMAQEATTRERQQREKAETAVQMRDDILNLTTHDLRSPVASVLSRAQLVQHRLHGAWRVMQPGSTRRCRPWARRSHA